jgi:hypothetical protein
MFCNDVEEHKEKVWPAYPTHIVAVVKSSSDRKNELGNFRHVLVYLLSESPASELYVATFRNTLFHLHR